MEKKYDSDSLRKLVYASIERIASVAGVKIPEKNLPEIKLSPALSGKSSYDTRENVMHLDIKDEMEEEILTHVGEESGHFVRNYVIKERGLPPDKKATEEFFGFLGRRIVMEPKGYKTTSTTDRKYALEMAKHHRANEKEKRELAKGFKEPGEELVKKSDELKKWGDETKDSEGKIMAYNASSSTLHKGYEAIRKGMDLEHEANLERHKRGSVLWHARGYKYAAQMDLQNTDIPKLYASPDEEVRHRFFRSDNNHESDEKRDKKSKSLEKLMGIFSLIITLFAFYPSITGNAIATSTLQKVPPINTPMLIIGIAGLVLATVFRINKKDKS